MRVLGLSDELVGAPRDADAEQKCYEVWRDNLLTLNIFRSLHAQWHIVAAPDGEMVRIGLRYESIEVAFRNTNGVPRRRHAEMFADLQAMQDAALRVMNTARTERREQRQSDLEAGRNSR